MEMKDNALHLTLAVLLPRYIYLPADQAQAGGELQTIMRLLLRERSRTEPGSTSVIARLMDVSFVYVIRAWLEQQPEHGAGWLGAAKSRDTSSPTQTVRTARSRY